MPKLELDAIAWEGGCGYPEPFHAVVEGRERRRLGDAGGLDQFGVNLTRLAPGAASALRHWHVHEDEFLMMLEGEAVLVEEGRETVMRPGDCATFKAGVKDGHHLVNRSDAEVRFLEVGTRSQVEHCEYPDVDLIVDTDTGPEGDVCTHRDGTPYP